MSLLEHIWHIQSAIAYLTRDFLKRRRPLTVIEDVSASFKLGWTGSLEAFIERSGECLVFLVVLLRAIQVVLF